MNICRCAVLATFFLISGCILIIPVSHKDVTNEPRYWGNYKPGEIIVLVEDVYIDSQGKWLIPEKHYNINVKDDIPFAWPRSFNEYNQAPDKYPELRILKKGIKIKCIKFFYNDHGFWSEVDVVGVIEEGDFKDYEVSIGALSRGANNSPAGALLSLEPDPKYLKPVEQRTDN